jgi:hypothetical protein
MKKNYLSLLSLLFFGLLSSVSFGQMNAVDDTFAVVYGAGQVTAGDFLINDTRNGFSTQAANVIISTVSTTNPGITISGTTITVAAGTPQGTYTLTYQICDASNPTLCDTAVATINTKIVANPDFFYTSICNVFPGNILGYGTDLDFIDSLNDQPAILQGYYTQPGNVYHPPTVTLSYIQQYPGIELFSNGDIYMNGGAAPGDYLLIYELCEIAHPTNCSTGYVTLNLYPGSVFAADDDFIQTPIDTTIGGTTYSVLFNDFSECFGNLNPSNATVLPDAVPNGLTLNPDGTIMVAIGTVPGIYLVNYTVCENGFSGCDQATATVYVTGVSSLVANYDSFVNYPNSTTASVLANDTLNGNPITNPSNVLVTGLNTPSGFTLNADGTVTIGANVPEGTYSVPYQICTISTPNDCYVNYAYVVVFKNRISGKVKFDANSNGCDGSDAYLNNISVKNINGSNTYSNYTNYNGTSQYYLIADAGNNTVSVTNLPSYFTVTPSTQVINFATAGLTATLGDFCVSINSNVNDLEVVVIPLFNVVPGLPALYTIWYKNNGSTTLSGQITFQFDTTKMSFLSSSPTPNTIGTNSLTYTFSNIAPFESRQINNVKFQVATPPTADSGQIVTFAGSITPVVSDATAINNNSTINQTIVNSQDPNDIVVHEGSTITLAKAQQDYLHYTIRFQNIGTSEAINIKVLNDLDAKLDWSTFQLLSTSHNCRVKNKNERNEFLFEGINLPGTANEPLSHGYITYKVKPISSIAVGNVIPNVANIYFDYNAPITTNIASTTIVPNLANATFALNNLNYSPNPVKNLLSISNNSIIDTIEITSILGQKMMSLNVNALQTELNLSELLAGIYFVKITSEGQEKTVKIIKD